MGTAKIFDYLGAQIPGNSPASSLLGMIIGPGLVLSIFTKRTDYEWSQTPTEPTPFVSVQLFGFNIRTKFRGF